MGKNRYFRKVDSKGKINIPKNFRDFLLITKGTKLKITSERTKIIIENQNYGEDEYLAEIEQVNNSPQLKSLNVKIVPEND